jgi:hypothetical protein
MSRLTADQLADIEAIKQLKARYFFHLDHRHFEDLRALFTEDADFDSARLGEYQMADLDAFIDYARRGLTGGVSVHHGHMPIIELTGPDTATGIWAMVDYVEGPDGQGGTRGFVGYGHYHEAYRRVGEEWKIARWAITRLRVDPLAPGTPLQRRPGP